MTQTLYQGCTMGDLIVRAIQRGQDRLALVGSDSRYTYRQFGELVARMVQALRRQGLQRGDRIATLSSNRPESFVISATGYVMGLTVLWMNPTSSEDDHAFILDDAGIGTLFVDPQAFGQRASVLRRRVPGLQRLFGLGPSEFGDDILALAAEETVQPLRPQAEADDPCVLVYTGGTTGKPKGVIHTHRVQVTMALQEMAEWDWPRDIRFLACTPITHAAGAMLMPVLLRSGTYFMEKGFDAGRFLQVAERQRITAAFLVPTMIYVLLDHPDFQPLRLNSLELIIYGAAPMSPSRLAEGMHALGPVFMQLYAQSEAPQTVMVLRQCDHDPERHPQRLASCGTPVAGNQVRLLDEAGHEVPVGEVGEICVRGPLVMQGYLNQPDETARALRHGWLHTGDLARQDADGFFYIVDRSKDMIISGGFNVYPREVEDALSRHPAVAAAAVVGVPDAKWGEAVRALVVLRPGARASEEELRAWVREHKGPVQSPKVVEFVESLPMTGLGKLDKKAIRARFWQGQQRAVH